MIISYFISKRKSVSNSITLHEIYRMVALLWHKMIHPLNCVSILNIESIVSDNYCSMLPPIYHLVQLENYKQYISSYIINSSMIHNVAGRLRCKIVHLQSVDDSVHRRNMMDANACQLQPNSPVT